MKLLDGENVEYIRWDRQNYKVISIFLSATCFVMKQVDGGQNVRR